MVMAIMSTGGPDCSGGYDSYVSYDSYDMYDSYCLLYTSDAAEDLTPVKLGGRRLA